MVSLASMFQSACCTLLMKGNLTSGYQGYFRIPRLITGLVARIEKALHSDLAICGALDPPPLPLLCFPHYRPTCYQCHVHVATDLHQSVLPVSDLTTPYCCSKPAYYETQSKSTPGSAITLTLCANCRLNQPLNAVVKETCSRHCCFRRAKSGGLGAMTILNAPK